MFYFNKKINLLSNITNTLSINDETENNFSNSLCPDQYVADFMYDSNKWKIVNSNISKRKNNIQLCRNLDIDYNTDINDSCILIILESPHYDEFISNIPIGPAIGFTGRLFEQNFEDIVNNSKNLSDKMNKQIVYKIIFMNAVQYQASQGIKPLNKAIRDYNWLNFWTNNFSNDLIGRIRLYTKPIIFNLCTVGNKNLQNHISTELTKNKFSYFIGYHPSSWFNKKRKIII